MDQMSRPMNWLLLRGLARDKRHWMQFGEIFEERIPGNNVFMLDLPGMGDQSRRPSPTKVANITDDIRHRWQQLSHDHGGPWGILGVSLGGMVAMDWCHRHSYDFQRLVLVNSSSGGISHPLSRLQLPIFGKFMKIARSTSADEKEKTILGFNSNIANSQNPAIQEAWAQFANESTNSLLNIARQIVAAAQYRAPKELNARTLVLSSLQDNLTDPSCSWKLARRFGASVIFHDSAGHDLPLDAPNWLVDQVRFWMQD